MKIAVDSISSDDSVFPNNVSALSEARKLKRRLDESWCARSINERFGSHSRRFVLAVGGHLDPKQLGVVPANVMVVSYAPQIEILKRSSLCITHAGLNTALESLSSGVPMIALPITNDQPGVAARIADKKVGVVMSPNQASPEHFVVAAIKQVLEDSTFQDNVRRVQKAIRSTDGLSIAAGILERAFELEEIQGAA